MTHPKIEERDPAVRIANWYKAHRTAIFVAVATTVVIAGGVWFWITAKQRREAFAASALGDARVTASAGNLALAVSDLSRVMSTYRGTTAAGEATILLAQIRLMENQAALAVTELRDFLASNPAGQFLGPAHSLLAVALEDTDNPTQAAQEYLAAAETSWYDFLQAQFLLDAGRTFAEAGDTAQAIASYERVLADYEETGTTVEARVRLAEIRRSAPTTSE